MIILIIFGTNVSAILLRMLYIVLFQPLVSGLLALLLWCTQTLLVLCLWSLTLMLGTFLPLLMIVLSMLFCPSYGPSWTDCLIFTIWSLRLRPLLVTLLPPCIWTKGLNLWDRSSRHSSLPKVLLIRLLFLTLLNGMDVLKGLIRPYWKRQKLCTNMPAYLKYSGKML